MVRQSSEMETNIVAVERIKEYTGITREVSILSASQPDTHTDRETDGRADGLLNLTYIRMACLGANVAVGKIYS